MTRLYYIVFIFKQELSSRPMLKKIVYSCILQWAEEGRGVVEAFLIGYVEIVPSSPGPFISASTSHVSDVPLLPVLDEPLACNCFVEGSRLLVNFVGESQC